MRIGRNLRSLKADLLYLLLVSSVTPCKLRLHARNAINSYKRPLATMGKQSAGVECRTDGVIVSDMSSAFSVETQSQAPSSRSTLSDD
jgi:hypothetical protein